MIDLLNIAYMGWDYQIYNNILLQTKECSFTDNTHKLNVEYIL